MVTDKLTQLQKDMATSMQESLRDALSDQYTKLEKMIDSKLKPLQKVIDEVKGAVGVGGGRRRCQGDQKTADGHRDHDG